MPKFLINSGLPELPVGVTDKEASLISPLYRSVAALAQQLAAVTGNVQYSAAELSTIDQFTGLTDGKNQQIYIKALEAIPYGALITLSVDAGKLAARKADASIITYPAHGICTQIGGIGVGEYGSALFMHGITSSVSGSVLGSTYYLSTAGGLQLAMPTADSVLKQIVGIGLGSAGIYLNIEPVGKRVATQYKPSAAVLRVLYTDGTFVNLAV